MLFACPACVRLDAVEERGNLISCRSCSAAWRVDTESRLHPASGGRPMTLRAAADNIRSRFPEPWLPADGALPAGELLKSEPVRVYDVTDPDPLLVGRGHLVLTADVLRVSGITPWSIPMADIRAEAVDLKRRLNFSSRRRVFEVVMPRESVIKWELFLRHVRTRTAAPTGDLRARRRIGGG